MCYITFVQNKTSILESDSNLKKNRMILFGHTYFIGVVKLVDGGMLTMPAMLIGNHIGRRCCSCWFEVLEDDLKSGVNIVAI